MARPNIIQLEYHQARADNAIPIINRESRSVVPIFFFMVSLSCIIHNRIMGHGLSKRFNKHLGYESTNHIPIFTKF